MVMGKYRDGRYTVHPGTHGRGNNFSYNIILATISFLFALEEAIIELTPLSECLA